MDCSLCQKKMDFYISGNLDWGITKDVKTHLDECSDCRNLHTALLITNQLIYKEKNIKSNSYLATRVMTQIESKEELKFKIRNLRLTQVIQPIFLTTSVILALFIGIYAGNNYQIRTASQTDIPEELLLMNDASLESLNLIVSEL